MLSWEELVNLVEIEKPSCRCGRVFTIHEIRSYDHPDGIEIDEHAHPQWIYFACPICARDLSINKYQNLTRQIYSICSRCKRMLDGIWVVEKNNQKTCLDCNYKELLEKYPTPPLESLVWGKVYKDNYRSWPHPYIPRKCPYCNGEIAGYPAGTDDYGHTYVHHMCEKCKVYFGYTD